MGDIFQEVRVYNALKKLDCLHMTPEEFVNNFSKEDVRELRGAGGNTLARIESGLVKWGVGWWRSSEKPPKKTYEITIITHPQSDITEGTHFKTEVIECAQFYTEDGYYLFEDEYKDTLLILPRGSCILKRLK